MGYLIDRKHWVTGYICHCDMCSTYEHNRQPNTNIKQDPWSLTYQAFKSFVVNIA